MVLEESFIYGNSRVHRLDPRVRIIVALAFSLVVAISDRFAALLLAILISVSLVFLARLPLNKVFSRLLIVNGLVFFLWIFLPFTLGNEQVFSLGPLMAKREGIVCATLITLKCNAIILALMALVATMSIFTVGQALGDLHVPLKIIHLFFFTYRYIHVIHTEYLRLMKAVKIRGFQPGTDLHTYRTYAYLVGMLLVRSYDRAKRVHMAMLCRGFTGKFFFLSQFVLKPSDLVILALMMLAVGSVGLFQWTRIIY